LNDSSADRGFSFNVLTLAGGTALSQAIGLVMIPLLTRLYTPSDYGNYALYVATFNLLVPLVHFRYALAIMLPKEDQEALEVFRLSLKLSILFGIVLFTTLLISDLSFLQIPADMYNPWFLALISLTLIFGGTTQAYSQWSNRIKNYFLMSLSRVTQVSGMVVCQSVTGFIWGSTLPGLVIGHVLGNAIGLLTLIIGNKNLKKTSLLLTPTIPLKNSMVRFKRFPLFTSGGSILDGVTNYGTPLLFAMYYQSDMVGRFALANTALAAPIMLIGHSISKVLYQRMSENIKIGLDIKDIVRTVLINQFLTSLTIGSIIYFFGPPLFGFFFGENWSSAGQFAQILVPAMFFQLMVSALQTVLLIRERQDLLLYTQILRAIVTVVSIMIPGIEGLDENTSMTIFSFSRALSNFVYLAIICRVARII
jgi:O-antigen/teichoic acid export membrane protein